MKPSDSALLILATQPSAGEVNGRLCPPLSAEQAFLLNEAFLRDVIEMAMESRLAARFLCYWPPESRDWFNGNFAGIDLVQQCGEGPGRRIAHAFEQILTIGYTPVIAIRADAPDLPPNVIVQAEEALRRRDLVVGPAGGDYYLIGLKEPAPELFRRVDWSKPQTLSEQLLAIARQLRLSAKTLDGWYRVDDVEKLKLLGRSETLRAYSKAALEAAGV